MNFKNANIRMICAIITFAVVLSYVVNNPSVIVKGYNAIITLLFPFLLGLGIAFIMNIPMKEIETTFFKDKNKKVYKFKRTISLLSAIILVVAAIWVVLGILIPELIVTVKVVKDSFPSFLDKSQAFLGRVLGEDTEIYKKIISFDFDPDIILDFLSKQGDRIVKSTIEMATSVLGVVTNLIVGVIFAIYVLGNKENLGKQLKAFGYAFLKEETMDEILKVQQTANHTFSGFMVGQVREAVIIGIMFSVSMFIFKMPFAIPIGVIIGFTALIPVFGAFIGMIIGAFLILVQSPITALWFIVLFFAIQFIENNFIYPKLVGGNIGLPAIWVFAAVIIGGDLMGVVGMLIFIPLCSIMYGYLRIIVYKRIEQREIDIDNKTMNEDDLPIYKQERQTILMNKNLVNRLKIKKAKKQTRKKQTKKKQTNSK